MENWIIHLEFLALIITFIGGFYVTNAKIERMGERIDTQGQRTDRLYEMFIDLLKESRK